ncbi:MAG: hypothetical protein WD249_08110 [Gaiellaceae bacterium]
MAATTLLPSARGGAGFERAIDASRVVDRTVICRVPAEGYPDSFRYLDSWAVPPVGKRAAAVKVFTSQDGRTGMNVSFGPGPYSARYGSGIVTVDRRQCSATRLAVPLSSKGLRGGKASRFGDGYRCDIPERVVIRVRAVFRRPVALRVDPRATYQLIATGYLASGQLAAATLQGRKLLVYGSADDATKSARIFVSESRCWLRN